MKTKITGVFWGLMAGILAAWMGGFPVSAGQASPAESSAATGSLPDWRTRAAMAVREADPNSPVFTEGDANYYGDAAQQKGIDAENSAPGSEAEASGGRTEGSGESTVKTAEKQSNTAGTAASDTSYPDAVNAEESSSASSSAATADAAEEAVEKIYGREDPCEPQQKSDTNTCRVLAMADVRGEYPHNLQTLLHNTETGSYYLIRQYINEDYAGYTYLPAGSYAVDEVAADDGNTDITFTVSGDSEFTLEDGESHTIQITSRAEETSTTESTSADQDETTENTARKAALEADTEILEEDASSYPAALPWRKVSQSGRGPLIQYDGLSASAYEFVLRITHSGPIGEARYVLYCNGTAQDEQILTDTIRLILPEGGDQGEDLDTGLTITCPEGDYAIDTTYSFSTLREWAVCSDAVGTGAVYMAGVPENREILNCQLKIVEPGPLGEATYILSGNGGDSWEKETVVPADGIIEAGKILIRLAPGEYAANDLYYAEIEGTPRKDYSNAVLIIILLIAAGIFAIIFLTLLRRRNGTDRFDLANYDSTAVDDVSENREAEPEGENTEPLEPRLP